LADELLFRLLALLERLGVWPSVVAWLAAALGAAAMAFVLRNEEVTIWRTASLVGLLAFAANLADYFVTLRHSPDLALEANPLWRNIVDHFGLRIAKYLGRLSSHERHNRGVSGLPIQEGLIRLPCTTRTKAIQYLTATGSFFLAEA